MTKTYGIVVLAAGGSSRFGSPKQLAELHDKPLVKRVVDAALGVPDSFVVVVIGAYRDAVANVIRDLSVTSVFNEEWSTGLASSIRAGILKLQQEAPGTRACIITVCDQPFLSSEVFNNLIGRHEQTRRGICASTYDGVVGTPALFVSQYYSHLLRLERDEGAKKIILANNEDVELVPFEQGGIDIDTQADYEKLS
jgi:molybdenum cofactor cytidylyltransferase